MQVLYTAEVNATGDGRNGHVTSSDGILDFDVRTPKEMGGGGEATNPEQLFAAGYAACFHSALRSVARRQNTLPLVEGSQVQARVGIGPNGAGGFGLEVWLTVTLPAADAAQAQELADTAHQVCPYSNATRGNIDVHIEVAK
ncbi:MULTISPECIES: organic hydroperoxide resistance protein [Dactylosporangium]|uniref:Stress-induced protein n=2 Tax=Dactylosporangium TaxID=35753 RepID=A0A9W6KIQ0_9ACTN|nr:MULTISPECIES: organic hydroperoxide resistance protein [Dactylosporangium]UAB98366.1 organic hydroperoxide resistance protein [Dactylosporangium vinaceum]UWZ46617.1 organic hydroperoxide resistance protein [Dactylosporangium matsuzakiense]GLL01249.1 stress-induced protein [Dactylosporangium matsuzakiense]